MYPFNPSQVIARRTLTGLRSGSLKVTLSFSLPLPMPDMPSDWYCAYRIEHLLDTPVDQYALGIDAVQALQLALVSAGEYLNKQPTPMTFIGMPNLGLPTVATSLSTSLSTSSE